MASAATEPVQGAWKKGPVFLELLRMATDPDPPPLASGYPVLPSSPSGPRNTHGSGFGLCYEVAGREQRPTGWPGGIAVSTRRFL